MIQLSTPQMGTLLFPLHIVDICIVEIISAGRGETAVKTLLWDPGMKCFASS